MFAESLEQRKNRLMEEKRKTLSARLARWAAELVLVFIGVYAAFWLNGYQQHQQEANRRDQILASIERTPKKNNKPRNLGVRWTPERCRRCIHSSLRLITIRAILPRSFK